MDSFNEFIKPYNTVQDILDAISKIDDNKEKGTMFEYFCFCILMIHPLYQYDQVYMYDNIPLHIRQHTQLPTKDKGIDILCVKDNKYIIVQCKFRSDINNKISWDEVSTYLASFHTYKINNGIYMSNCVGVCDELLTENNISTIRRVLNNFFQDLSPDFINNIKNYLLTSKVETVKYKPLEYQLEIITKAVEHFKVKDKGQLLMCCGTGKTLTSSFIVEKLNYNNVIVSVPSLLLLSQFLLEYAQQKIFTEYLLIGSDIENNIKKLEGMTLVCDLEEIKEWLQKSINKKRLIITTYQSSDLLKKALNETNQVFDICIYDEAHKTTGKVDKQFSLLLDDTFKVNKRLFLTATPRAYYDNLQENEIQDNEIQDNEIQDDSSQDSKKEKKYYCMNDESVYGQIIHEISLRDAIDNKFLVDYEIITPITTDKEIKIYIKKNKLIPLEELNSKYDTKMVASALLLLKNMNTNNKIRKVLTYHNSIQESKNFMDLLKELIKSYENLKDLKINYLSGDITMKSRIDIINVLKTNRSIICSAKVLTEGINIKEVDTVVFVSAKSSYIDIIQSVGRGLRLYSNNEYTKVLCYIIIPTLITDNGECIDDYKNIWNILRGLSESDGNVLEYFKEIKEKGTSNKICKTTNSLTDSDNKIITKFIDKLDSQTYRYIDGWNYMLSNIIQFVEKHNRRPNRTNKSENNMGRWLGTQLAKYDNETDILDERCKLFRDFKEKYKYIFKSNEEIWNDNYNKLLEFIKNNEKLPSKNSEIESEKRLGTWIGTQNKNYLLKKEIMKNEEQRLKWETLKKNNPKLFQSNEEIWNDNYNKLLEFIKNNNKIPNKNSEIESEKRLGIWVGNQNTNYLLEKKIMKNEEQRLKWETLKKNNPQLFQSNDEIWNDNYNKLLEFIKNNEKLPSKNSEIESEKRLGKWIQHQNTNYSQKKEIMKNEEQRLKLVTLKKNNPKLFQSNDEIWDDNYNKLLEFIKNNEKLPSKNSVIESEKRLGKWIGTQNKTYLENKYIMSNEEIRKKWETLKKNNPKLFQSNDEIWDDNYNKLLEFIKNNEKLPSKNSEIESEKRLGNWIQHQNTNYSQKKEIMKNEEQRLKWDTLKKNNPKLFQSTDETWYDNLTRLKNYIETNNKTPNKKTDRKLTDWLSHQQQNYKNKKHNMKYPQIYHIWSITRLKYPHLLLNLEEQWYNTLFKVTLWIERTEKIPINDISKFKEEQDLALWIENNKNNYIHKTDLMSNKEIYNTWTEYIKQHNI